MCCISSYWSTIAIQRLVPSINTKTTDTITFEIDNLVSQTNSENTKQCIGRNCHIGLENRFFLLGVIRYPSKHHTMKPLYSQTNLNMISSPLIYDRLEHTRPEYKDPQPLEPYEVDIQDALGPSQVLENLLGDVPVDTEDH